jgi:hypothetical protein
MVKKFTRDQKEILFGILLGDAHLETQNNEITFRLKVEQSLKHKAYLLHLYEVFKPWVPSLPQDRIIYYKNTNQSTNVRFSTLTHISFRFFGKQFYKNKKKVVPKLIHRWLTPRALAYWFMDDGSMKSIQSKGVILNTQGFYYADVQTLCNALQKNFNLSCWPRKQKNTYQIYISGKSYEILRDVIYEFIIPEMRYKFPLPRKNKQTLFGKD